MGDNVDHAPMEEAKRISTLSGRNGGNRFRPNCKEATAALIHFHLPLSGFQRLPMSSKSKHNPQTIKGSCDAHAQARMAMTMPQSAI